MDKKYQNTIGERIRELRDEKGISQEELAKKLHLSREVIAKWEIGCRDLKTEYTIKLADCFGVTSDYILRGVKAENLGAHKQTGLSDRAIDMLRLLSAEYAEPPELQGIKEKVAEISRYCKKKAASLLPIDPGEEPPELTNAEEDIYRSNRQNEKHKKMLETIDLLLSSCDGNNILVYMARYFDVDYDTRFYDASAGDRIACSLSESIMLREAYAKEIMSYMQDLRSAKANK